MSLLRRLTLATSKSAARDTLLIGSAYITPALLSETSATPTSAGSKTSMQPSAPQGSADVALPGRVSGSGSTPTTLSTWSKDYAQKIKDKYGIAVPYAEDEGITT